MFDNFGLYIAFLLTSVALLLAAIGAYVLITPIREMSLIRAGNKAAAVSLGGAVIGLALPLFGVASSTFDFLELAAWGAVGLALQVGAYLIVSLALPHYRHNIENDQISYGIAGAALSIAVGLVNAGAIAG